MSEKQLVMVTRIVIVSAVAWFLIFTANSDLPKCLTMRCSYYFDDYLSDWILWAVLPPVLAVGGLWVWKAKQ